MRIVHYLFGCPPVRGGGLVKYALELAEAQSLEEDVFLLVPGPIAQKRAKRDKVFIKRAGYWKKIPKYAIYNPLPIPMSNGIVEIDDFMLPCNGKVYREFLDKIQPDVIHVHTLMGIHKEFFIEANRKKIPIIYTTHDYFGICPTTNLFVNGKVCDAPGTNCATCSKDAFSNKRICLEQSKVYQVYRSNEWLIQLLRRDSMKNIGQSFRSQQPQGIMEKDVSAIKGESLLDPKYVRLLEYYRDMFENITNFHFNSNIAKEVYEKHLGLLSGRVIYISNKSVKDNREIHKQNGKLKIGFLGGDAAFKGLGRLKKVIGEMYAEGKEDIELQIYGSLNREEYPFCSYYGVYAEEERGQVFGGMDVLAVPSVWMETFAMVVWEAISYGVPVLITDKVGAKGLIEASEEPIGMVLADKDEAWKACINELYENREKVYEYSKNIKNRNIDFEYGAHVKEIHKLYEDSLDK